MKREKELLNVTIDNKAYRLKKGLTILEAAEQNDIYIPTLCSHKDLSPYGGCRMCIVEVEGMRNFPTACTTPLQDGMIIRTHTAQIQSIRQEILQLFMSEHTSSCLICDEKEQCYLSMDTIRKAGVTTGCRYCPKDHQCELQDVVEKMGITEMEYPIFYRNLRVEKEDPFYDRDYNLCILCGRCVRVCQEVRLANVLAFKQKGRDTIIGPAYSRSHLEAGCEFCGACVEVCPTGTLVEKARKWEGITEREEVTTCSYCGVGCQIRLQVKGDRIIGSLPEKDPLVNNGQLCVKGRFCITEMVSNYQRITQPFTFYNSARAEISWEEAVRLAAEKLAECKPEEFGMLVSPNCTNEDLYVAQKFARLVMNSNQIDTGARLFYGSGFNAYLNLLEKAVPLANIKNASVILSVGLDTRYGRSVVGVELRRAMQAGSKIITIHPREHSLSLTAEKWIQPLPGEEIVLLEALVKLTGTAKKHRTRQILDEQTARFEEDITEVVDLLKNATAPVILVGSEFLQYHHSSRVLESVEQLAENTGAGIMPLPAQNNLFGSILMGAYPEILPGGYSAKNREKRVEIKQKWNSRLPAPTSQWTAESLMSGQKLKVLYLVGEVPPDTAVQRAEFVIFQNIFPPESAHAADLILPAAAFTEIDGSFVNGAGRVQRVRKAVNPPGNALPDWEILCRVARKMGKSGFDFSSAKEIHHEIAAFVSGFKNFNKPKRHARPLRIEGKLNVSQPEPDGIKINDKKFPYLLSTSIVENSYRGFPLSSRVDGARVIFEERVLHISPQDAGKTHISEGEEVEVTSIQFKKTWQVKIDEKLPRGMLRITLPRAAVPGANPFPVKIRKRHV